MRLRAFILFLAALSATELLGASAQASGPRDRLVYASNRDGNTDLWARGADGSSPVRLTTDPAHDVQPDVSPDGKQVVFVRGATYGSVPASGDLWVTTADGRDPRLLLGHPGAAEYRPDFSPDGKRVLFTRHADGVGLAQELWVVERDGTRPRRVVENATYGQWSPNGKRLAYVTDPAGVSQVAVSDADGRRPVVLTKTGSNVAPQWSPDGRRLVFTSFRNGKGEIWAIDVDGRNERLVTASRGKEGFATWSPDGTRIAFASTRHTPCPKELSDLCPQRIHTVKTDGGDVRAISDGITDSFPAYFPRR